MRSKVIAATAGLALSLGLGAGVAAAQPDIAPVVNTTCSYDQVIAALNAESPSDGAQFTASPVAVGWLHSFLASPVPQRRTMIQQVQNIPEAEAYTGLVLQVVNTCKNF